MPLDSFVALPPLPLRLPSSFLRAALLNVILVVFGCSGRLCVTVHVYTLATRFDGVRVHRPVTLNSALLPSGGGGDVFHLCHSCRATLAEDEWARIRSLASDFLTVWSLS